MRYQQFGFSSYFRAHFVKQCRIPNMLIQTKSYTYVQMKGVFSLCLPIFRQCVCLQ